MKTRKSKNGIAHAQKGFSLFEMLVAILMLSVGILAAVATISAGVIWAREAKDNMTLGLIAQSASIYCIDQKIMGSDVAIPAEETSGYALRVSVRETTPTAPGAAAYPGQYMELTLECYENARLREQGESPIDTFVINVWYRGES